MKEVDMRNRLVTIGAIIALLVSLIALWKAMTAQKEAASGEWGNQRPNITAEQIDRVQDATERSRMEKYVDDLQASKHVVKSFQGPSGETIDCVDIYSQPGLKRQGMEGHQVQLVPTSQLPVPEVREGALAQEAKVRTPGQLFMLTGQSCPDKTAPMRRLTMDTLKRFRTLDDFLRKEGVVRKPIGCGSGSAPHEWAHAYRNVANWGGESIFNVFSPYVQKDDEFSLSQMWVTRGAGSNLETVEGGWQVYEDLYGDWKAHLFIYFTPDNYGSGGCYNTSCSGFVQVANTVYLGGGFTNYSVRGGDQYEFKLLWYKDGRNGSWWLRYGDTWVGYYPRSLFDANGLRDEAGKVDFGGEIVNTSPDGQHTRTDMGSGHWPYEGFSWAAYQRSIRYVDTSNYYQKATGLTRAVTNDQCYDLSLFDSSGDWGVYFYFGGSGRNSSCP
jgi:Neprosin/Neprosin activation peptide